MFQSVGRILRWAKGYRRRMILGFVCSFFATWCTAGPVMLAAWALGRLIGNAWGENEISASLPWLCLVGITALILLRFLFTYWKNRLQESIGTERAADQRMELGDMLKRVSLGYFARNNLGDILTALTTELSTLELQSMKMVDAVNQRLYPGGGDPAVRGHLLPPAALVALVGVLVSAFACGALGGRAPAPPQWATRAQEALSGAAIEYIHGLPVVKSFGQDAYLSSGSGMPAGLISHPDQERVRLRALELPAPVRPAGGVRGAGPHRRATGSDGGFAAPVFSDDRSVFLHHLRERGGHQRRGSHPVGDGTRCWIGWRSWSVPTSLTRMGGDYSGAVRCRPLPCVLWLRPARGAPRCDLPPRPRDHHCHRGAVRLRQEYHLQPGGSVL